MPNGIRWSKEHARWVRDDENRELYYDGFDMDAWGLLISFWRYYPDKFLDLMESDNPKYSLEIVQRVMLRIAARYEEVFESASRGTTKSFCGLAGEEVSGILYPGVTTRYAGPAKEQLAQIVQGVQRDILTQYPGLADYWEEKASGKDTFELVTACGSVISIKTNRGDTCNRCIAEEVAQADKGKAFDHEQFRSAILPSVRGKRMVNRMPDPYYLQTSHAYFTSTGSVFNESYEYWTKILHGMLSGDTRKYAIAIPSEVAVLSRVRDTVWRDDLKSKLTAEEWLREMDSIWTGNSENPLISEKSVVASKNLMVMEDCHCGDRGAFYIVAYDVSYADGAKNAKCACAVLKCEQQEHQYMRSRYMKSLVYVTDSPPPPSANHQARILKSIWKRYCIEGGQTAYIAVDSNQYGRSVTEELHKDLGDGLPPLCCMNHEFPELEKKDALPVIYAIHATPGNTGAHDPDGEMIRYMELEFDQGNFRLLTTNVYDGVEAYKKAHHIKDDDLDARISVPYRKTKEMITQLSNLRKKTSGYGIKEERASKSIQRDMWSALKYAGRVASVLEYENLVKEKEQESSWTEEYAKYGIAANMGFEAIPTVHAPAYGLARRGGNRL